MPQRHLLLPSYDRPEVVASVLIAAIAGYAALTLASRVSARRAEKPHAWTLWGGVAMGLGIAATHFVGTLAMELPVPIAYESGRTVLSVLFAIAASTVALHIAGTSDTLRAPRLIGGAVMFGAAVVGMHYVGISALRGPIHIGHDTLRVAVAGLIAVTTGGAALWLAFRLRERDDIAARFQRLGSAVLLGGAVSGMHYLAMSAMEFHLTVDAAIARTSLDGPVFTGRGLSVLIVAVAIVVLLGAIIGAFIDQKARHDFSATQSALEEREAEAVMATELYRLLAEHATDMISTHRPDGRFDYAAPSWAEFIGIQINEMIGHQPIEFAHPEDIALMIANYHRGLESSDLITTLWRCRRRDGYAWLETTTRPVRDDAGKLETFVCATRDVSERMRMEEQLTRSEARFRAASEGSFDAFFVFEAKRDADGTIVDFIYSELNRRAEALINRTRSNVIGHGMMELFPRTAHSNIEKLARVVESGEAYEEEVEYKPASRPARWLHHQIIPLGDGVAVTCRDISDRKHAEEELRAMTLGDDLTGLYNRRGFRMLAEQHLRLVKRGGPMSLLVAFDLDGFKRVNDVYGHAEGDAALKRVASILRVAFRDSDILARFGGDEFVVLALDCGDMREQLLARVEAAVNAHNLAAARPYSLSLSLGTARLDPFHPVTLDELMAQADAELYEAKRNRAMREMMA